jgi:hypothetical protein
MQMTFDHKGMDRLSSRLYLIENSIEHLGLTGWVLTAIRMAAINHQ